MRPWILSEVNYGYVKNHPYEVAVLPLGATEPHNLHLPYGTDTLEAAVIGDLACEEAFDRGARVVLLPPIPYGTETNQAAFHLSMNLNPSTLSVVISDLVESLVNHGIRKIMLLNSHGGNEFKPLLRELHGKTTAHLFLCDWFRGISADLQAEIFDEAGDHAGEMETAIGMAYFADLIAVDPASGEFLADDGAVRPARFDAVNRGWVSITRRWDLLTTNSGSGNPHAATAEKGRRFVEGVAERITDFLVELAASELDQTFPF